MNAPITKPNMPGRLYVILALIMLVYVCWTKSFDVYKYILGGIVYELLWLPMILSLFVIPVLVFLDWRKAKFKSRTFFPLTIIVVIVIAYLVFG